MMHQFETNYSGRPWNMPESVLDFPAIIAQRQYISQLPLGNLPADATDWLTLASSPSPTEGLAKVFEEIDLRRLKTNR